MTATPRTATATALTDGEVWEIRRNMLDRLMRLPSLKQFFEGTYRNRVMGLTLRESELFKHLDGGTFERVVNYLQPRISFARVSPGRTLFEQGDAANAVYFVRIGHVRIGTHMYGNETRVLTHGPGAVVGEIGLLGLTAQDGGKSVEEVDAALSRALARADGDLEPGDSSRRARRHLFGARAPGTGAAGPGRFSCDDPGVSRVETAVGRDVAGPAAR